MRRVAVLLAAAFLVLPATPATAAPATVTWTVQPATADGPDGRRWAEHTLDPGQHVTDHLAVRNLGDATAVFALKAADGYLTDKGRFNMLPSDRRSADGGTWITVRDTVTVKAGQTVVVPFTITVPRDATPGDHPAGIAATIAGQQGTVQVESRVGYRVLLRASGTITPTVAASGVRVRHEHSWNPLRPGAVTATWTLTNTGNVRLNLDAATTVTSFTGATGHTPVGELLPGGTRTVTTRVGGVWTLGRLHTTVTLTPVVAGEPAPTDPTAVTVTTWALPWPQLLLAAALAGLALAARALGRHRRRRLETLLAQARREGARAAAS